MSRSHVWGPSHEDRAAPRSRRGLVLLAVIGLAVVAVRPDVLILVAAALVVSSTRMLAVDAMVMAEPAMIAWRGPGTQAPAPSPRGLDPRGYESLATWGLVGIGLFVALLFGVSFLEVSLARASANGILSVGNIELASATTTNGRFSARVSLLPDLVLAVVFAAGLTWGARKIVGGLRARNTRRRPPEDDA